MAGIHLAGEIKECIKWQVICVDAMIQVGHFEMLEEENLMEMVGSMR